MSEVDDSFLKEIKDSFLTESEELLTRFEECLLSLEKDEDHSNAYADLKRIAHNFKGSGKAVGFDSLSTFCHAIENLLVCLSSRTIDLNPKIVQLLLNCNDELKSNLIALRNDNSTVLNHSAFVLEIENTIKNEDSNTLVKPDDETGEQQKFFQAPVASKNNLVHEPKKVDNFIRVPLSKIDDLLNTFGEQVIYLSALDHYKDNFVKHEEEIQRILLTLKKLAFDLQHSTMTLRMVNLKSLFSKLDRCVRDASLGIGKKVEAEFFGSHLELDKTIVDQISDPLIHIIRNAVDHGIEDDEERASKQKNESGKVTITARREGGSFVIEIKDDGKGLDKDKILKKAQERGLVRENESLSEKEILELIFENGFSTKEQVSEFSGRGVGMNVVKEVVTSLKGTCEIESTLVLIL
jgi:two-component system chemotaxis sensor kinase CheA